ncbi:flagellar export protein FliJ [Sulfurimonas sp. HSL-1716]|uniref:flagellar export protein FliJ n=1 Tax=Hydrocurvibacter sulfurireducens TaxID=3131937 RepID=UPI0031F7D851
MKTRYTPLLKIKKNDLDRCERELQQANANLKSAESSLAEAYGTLQSLQLPKSGKIQDMLSAKAYINSQRLIVNDKKDWVLFASKQVDAAISKLKSSNVEYEKFKYLNLEEVKKALKQRSIKESKDLDEIAIMTHNGKGNI